MQDDVESKQSKTEVGDTALTRAAVNSPDGALVWSRDDGVSDTERQVGCEYERRGKDRDGGEAVNGRVN